MENVKQLFVDGGLIWDGSPGGSTIGGTWAWVAIDEQDELVSFDSGFISMPDRETTNNHTEFFATIKAMEAMDAGWSGTLSSDSKITLGRLFKGHNTKNLPNEWVVSARRALNRLGVVTPRHLDGHPTKDHLKAGIGKRGNPVSKWNVKCDLLCAEAKEPYALKK